MRLVASVFFLILGVTTAAHADVPSDELITHPADACVAVLRDPQYGFAAACSGVRLPCFVQWAANVSPARGQELGVVCTNGRAEDGAPGPAANVGVDEERGPQRHALILDAAGHALFDSGELGMSGLEFAPMNMFGAEFQQVLFQKREPDGEEVTTIIAWNAERRSLRSIFSQAGIFAQISMNLVPSSIDPVTITTCTQVFSWNPTRFQFVVQGPRRGASPPSCSAPVGGE